MSGGTVSSWKRSAAIAFAAGIALAVGGTAKAGEPLTINPALVVPVAAEVGAVEDVAPAPAAAATTTVLAQVDLSDQTMRIWVNGLLEHEFKVSTGRKGYTTPTGEWDPKWLSRYHRSKKYHNAPMPWSVFFYGGYAVHGTDDLKRLGKPASHGCVRLHPDNAKIFFKLVQDVGKKNVRIAIVQ